MPDSLTYKKNFIYGTETKAIYYHNLNEQVLNSLKDILDDSYFYGYGDIKLVHQDINTLLEENKSFKEINNICKKNPGFAR